MSDDGEAGRRALLRREAVVGIVVNAVLSVVFFLVVFGWTTVATRALALDCFGQTLGITTLGGLVPSLLTLAKVRAGKVRPAGPVPSGRGQVVRVLACAAVAVPVLGGAAALLLMAFAPAAIAPLPAMIVKALYGSVVGTVTTPPLLRMALGMGMVPHRAPARLVAGG